MLPPLVTFTLVVVIPLVWSIESAAPFREPKRIVALASDGEILAIDPPKRLEFTFRALWDEKLTAEGPAREVWELAEINGMVELKLEIYEIGPLSLEDFTGGYPYIVAGLKSLIETGEALPPTS